MSEIKTLYKLMTLYTLSRVDSALTNTQIANVFLDLGYTNYFNVQYTLSELLAGGLVQENESADCRCYLLTDAGRESLEALRNTFSAEIRSEIDDYLRRKHAEFREALSVRADYYRTTGGDYAVRCRVQEQAEDLIDLTLTVPNETQAKVIAGEWKEKSQQIYAYVMQTLTRPGHTDT